MIFETTFNSRGILIMTILPAMFAGGNERDYRVLDIRAGDLASTQHAGLHRVDDGNLKQRIRLTLLDYRKMDRLAMALTWQESSRVAQQQAAGPI